MALMGFHGFDDGVASPGVSGGSPGSATAARTGAGGMALGGTTFMTVTPGGSASTIIVGMACWFAALPTGAIRSFEFREGTTVHCGVGFDASGHLTIYNAAGSVVATSTAALSAQVWYYLEFKAVINDTTGSVEIQDGNGGTIVSASSLDTKNGGTGVVSVFAWRKANSSGTSDRYDDMYILDTTGSAPYNTYLGDVAVRTLLPSGNGSNSDWTGSDGNSTDNYLLVDEVTSSSTDYVAASAAGKTDLYQMADIPTTDLPLATQTLVYAAKSDAGVPPVMKPITKGDGGTVLEESAITLSTTYQVFAGAIRTTDPDGDALTATNINGIQVGVRTA